MPVYRFRCEHAIDLKHGLGAEARAEARAVAAQLSSAAQLHSSRCSEMKLASLATRNPQTCQGIPTA